MTHVRPRILILGIGNPDRGDDAAGPECVSLLGDLRNDAIEVGTHSGEASSLLVRLDGIDAAIFIDACVSGAAPGTIHRFDASATPLPERAFALSTHGFGLPTALELARALGTMPRRVIVLATEGESFDAGAPLSRGVRAALHKMAASVRDELDRLL